MGISNKEKNFISAVVYVHNDEDIIRNFLKNLNKELDKNFLKYEIICVNDCSEDNSVRNIKQFAKSVENATITVVNMSFHQGKEFAMNAGMDVAIGDFVYEFDSPVMDYDTKVILEIYKKSLEEFDIVSASANKKRYKTSALFYKIYNRFSDSEYKINTERFRIISRRAINRAHSTNKTVPYRKAVYANCGLKMATITYKPNGVENKKMDSKEKKERERNAIDALILFTDIGYKFAIAMSVFMMIATLIVFMYTISVFIQNTPIAGWTTTMLFLSIGFFGIFVMFAIVLKYLSIIMNLIFKKSKYVIESIEKIN